MTSPDFSPVKYLGSVSESLVSSFKSPFAVRGAPNVFLETVKRGEADFTSSSSTTTVVLRLYEAFGGHAHAQLKIARDLSIAKAYLTNLLEDEDDELNLMHADDTETSGSVLHLDFRGFEVKTVKLVIHDSESVSVSQRE